MGLFLTKIETGLIRPKKGERNTYVIWPACHSLASVITVGPNFSRGKNYVFNRLGDIAAPVWHHH